MASPPEPGGIPLRPLALGDILNGSITAIRRNPAATVGLAAIVFGITGVVTTVVSVAVRGSLSKTYSAFNQVNGSVDTTRVRGSLSGLSLAFGVSAILGLIALVILTGMLTAVIGRGVLGQQVSIGQAWQLVRPRLAAILGVTVLSWVIFVGLWVPYAVILVVLALANLGGLALGFGILGFLVMIAIEIFVWVRLSLAAPVVVLEKLGPFAALRRSWSLVSQSFWRLFGILLLAIIIVGVAGLILQLPFDFVRAAVGGGFGNLGSNTSIVGIIIGGIGGIVVGAITRPVLAGVTVLLYVDMRMRKEGIDLALRDAAQNQQMTGEEFAGLWRAPAAGQGPAATPPASW
jgi:hypothetical protein